MNKQTVYVPISVEDKLPELNKPVIVIATHVLSNAYDEQLREAVLSSSFTDGSNALFDVGKTANDHLFIHDKVTHWLSPRQAVILDDGEVERYEKMEESLCLKDAWSLPEVLNKLIEASDILLDKKNYDGHGWEEISHARSKAKFILEQFHELLSQLK